MSNSPAWITVSQGPSTSFYKTGTKTPQRSHVVSEDQLIWCMHKHLLSAMCNINTSNFIFILIIMVNDWLCKLHIWLLMQTFGYYAITIPDSENFSSCLWITSKLSFSVMQKSWKFRLWYDETSPSLS